MPKVTIIIPMYNVENYIEKCIQSCINQTMKDIQIILINDESTDDCLNIAKRYEEKDSRILVIDQKNSGVSVARNKGIENAKAEWIMFVDGDDWLEQDAVENMYKVVLNNNADIIVSCYYTNKENIQKKDQFLKYKNMEFKNDETIELVKSSICKTKISNSNSSTNIGVPWAKLYNKKFLINNQCYFKVGLKRMQDMVFNLYAFYLAKNVICFEAYTYHYRINNTSATHKFTEDFFEISKNILKNIMYFIKEYHLENKLMEYYKAKSIKLFIEMIRIQYVPDELKLNNKEKITELKKILKSDYYKNCLSLKLNKLLDSKEKIINTLINLKLINVIYYIYRIKYKFKFHLNKYRK